MCMDSGKVYELVSLRPLHGSLHSRPPKCRYTSGPTPIPRLPGRAEGYTGQRHPVATGETVGEGAAALRYQMCPDIRGRKKPPLDLPLAHMREGGVTGRLSYAR